MILWSILALASWQRSPVWAQTNSHENISRDKPFAPLQDLLQAPRTSLWCTSWLWTWDCVLTCVERLNEGICGLQFDKSGLGVAEARNQGFQQF